MLLGSPMRFMVHIWGGLQDVRVLAGDSEFLAAILGDLHLAMLEERAAARQRHQDILDRLIVQQDSEGIASI